MNLIWLLRAARWARNPPSSTRVKLVLAVVMVCLILVGIEHFWGWPKSLTLDAARHRNPLR
jgi:predicted acyltransferase